MDNLAREILINRILEGVANEAEMGQLEVLLEQDGSALDEYLDLAAIHAMLQWRLGGSEGHGAEGLEQGACVVPACSVPAQSPRFGSLRKLSRGFGSMVPNSALALLVLVSTTVLLAGLMTVVSIRGRQAGVDQTDVAQSKEQETRSKEQGVSSDSPLPAGYPPGGPLAAGVARLTNMADCQWIVADAAPKPGDRLRSGQSLQLAAGVACMEFDVGATLVLQGPAQLSIISAKQIRLDRGKLAAEIKSPEAHGFTVITPQGSVVDLGTEFGVEVAPQGRGKVHVFRGKVEYAPNLADGTAPLTTHCLLAHSGARVEPDSSEIQLVEDTGETFVRSLDRLEKDRHVVAYWRFEDRPLGPAPHTVRNTDPHVATVDSSFNGNDLYAWSPESRPKFSADVPRSNVTQTGAANRACLDNSDPPAKDQVLEARNVYTHSAFSHAAPLDIQKIAPLQWTVEASVKPMLLGVAPQTILGRDARFPPSHVKPNPPQRLSLEITPKQRFAVRFYDANNRMHEAVAADLPITLNRWYNLAAVSDGKTLKFYIDSQDGRGYRLRASKVLPKTGNTALGKGDDKAEWTIGRGLESGKLGAMYRGCVDEIRISDIARLPGELLFAPNKAVANKAIRAEVKSKSG